MGFAEDAACDENVLFLLHSWDVKAFMKLAGVGLWTADSCRGGYSRSFHFALNSTNISLHLHLLTNPGTNLLLLQQRPNESRLRRSSPRTNGPMGGGCTACYFDNKQSRLCLLHKCSFYVSIAFFFLLIKSHNEIGHGQSSNAKAGAFPIDELISSKSLLCRVFKISRETDRKHFALPREETKENSTCWASINYIFLMH